VMSHGPMSADRSAHADVGSGGITGPTSDIAEPTFMTHSRPVELPERTSYLPPFLPAPARLFFGHVLDCGSAHQQVRQRLTVGVTDSGAGHFRYTGYRPTRGRGRGDQ
jgi:hypothetical protein